MPRRSDRQRLPSHSSTDRRGRRSKRERVRAEPIGRGFWQCASVSGVLTSARAGGRSSTRDRPGRGYGSTVHPTVRPSVGFPEQTRPRARVRTSHPRRRPTTRRDPRRSFGESRQCRAAGSGSRLQPGRSRRPFLSSGEHVEAERLIERHGRDHVNGEQRYGVDALDRLSLPVHAGQPYRKGARPDVGPPCIPSQPSTAQRDSDRPVEGPTRRALRLLPRAGNSRLGDVAPYATEPTLNAGGSELLVVRGEGFGR
jgi:hypothetical protein